MTGPGGSQRARLVALRGGADGRPAAVPQFG